MGNANKKKKKRGISLVKHRGQVRTTKEMIKTLLGLPEDVELDSIIYEANREIYNVYISTDEVKEGWTHATGEGQEPVTVNYDLHEETRIAQALRIVQNAFPEYQTNELYRDVLREEE